MSTLFVNKLKAAVGSVIDVPSGQVIKAETEGSIVAPGQVIQHKVYHYTNDGPNSSQFTAVTTPGTGSGSGSSSWGKANAITTTSQTPTASEFQVDITPKYSNSLIKVEFDFYAHPQAAAQSPGMRIVRTISGGTATVIWQPPTNSSSAFGLDYHPQETAPHSMHHIIAFDKPSSTSSINYRAYYYNYSTSSCMYFSYVADDHWAPPQAFIVTEIAQ